PRADSSRNSAAIASWVDRSTPANGSSSTSSSGSRTRARAIITRRRCPPDMRVIGRSARWAMPTWVRARITRGARRRSSHRRGPSRPAATVSRAGGGVAPASEGSWGASPRRSWACGRWAGGAPRQAAGAGPRAPPTGGRCRPVGWPRRRPYAARATCRSHWPPTAPPARRTRPAGRPRAAPACRRGRRRRRLPRSQPGWPDPARASCPALDQGPAVGTHDGRVVLLLVQLRLEVVELGGLDPDVLGQGLCHLRGGGGLEEDGRDPFVL